MLTDRDKSILELLLKENQVTVKQLAAHLFVSEPSIRRDLARLEKQHLIKRVYGGAMLEQDPTSKTKIPFAIRELEQSNEKMAIARKAIHLVHDNDVIFLDASTTVHHLVPLLVSKKNITVVTNGVKSIDMLADYNISTIVTGGNLVASCKALEGEATHSTIDSINADIAFFSCRGVSDNGYITDINISQIYIRQHMMRNAKRSYLLCTSNKFGKQYYYNLAHISEIDGIISDKPEDEILVQ